MRFFNVNQKIVDSSYSENEWISYYEAQVEPDVIQFAQQHTRALFSRRQRAFGNSIEIQTSGLQYAAMSTKLALKDMVDRGAMKPNEWRSTLGLGPIEGGDEPIRRLDTAPVKEQTEEVKE
jgi:phage portal protein BeeE